MDVQEVYNELTKISKRTDIKEKHKENLFIARIVLYAKANNISNDEALDRLNDYAETLKQ